MMTCGEARRLAWPDGAPRAVNDAVAAAEAHVAGCAACRAFVADMQAVAHRISTAAPRPSAPLETRERLFAALARARATRERDRATRWSAVRLAAAGVAAVLVLAAVVWRLPSPTGAAPDPVALLAEDHRRSLGTDDIASGDTAAVARWLAPRVGFAVRVPTFAGGRLAGARLSDIDGRRGAVLVYRVDGREVSYYMLPRGAVAEPPPAASPVVHTATWAGFGVASWREPGLVHVLVADLPTARLQGLAHECIRQMARSRGDPNRADVHAASAA